MISQLESLPGHLLDQQDSQAVLLQYLKGIEDQIHSQRSKPQRRLIQKEQHGLIDEGTTDGYHLLLATAQQSCPLVQSLFDARKQMKHIFQSLIELLYPAMLQDVHATQLEILPY